MMQSMVIQMNDRQLQTLAQLQAFLDGTAAVDFAVASAERYGFIGRTVRRFAYGRLKRAQKAVVLRFQEGLALDEIATVTGAPLGTVKSRLYRGLNMLMSRLKGAQA